VRALAAALSLSLAGTVCAADLPAWQSLSYELRSFGVTARSELALWPAEDGAMALTSTSFISDNRETVDLVLGACGELRRRSRFSSGRDQRFKSWDYLPGHVLRVRREPPRRGGGEPTGWPESSRHRLVYPEERQGRVLTDPHALLLFGGWLLDGSASTREVLVQTDRNFYLVELSRQGAGSASEAVAGDALQAVLVKARPIGVQPDKPDFSLLGLGGDLTLWYDHMGIPRAVRGRAPRIGSTTVSLVDVVMRGLGPEDVGEREAVPNDSDAAAAGLSGDPAAGRTPRDAPDCEP
jgi:hypothetical protein